MFLNCEYSFFEKKGGRPLGRPPGLTVDFWDEDDYWFSQYIHISCTSG